MLSSLKSRRLVVLSAAVAVFAVWAFAQGEADARVPTGPRLDSASVGCGQVQDKYDKAVRDLENASKNGTQAQYDAALENLKSIIQQWNGSPCSRTFGSLIYRKSPGGKVNGATPTLAEPNANSGTSTGGSPNGGNKGAGKTKSMLKRNRSAS
ncbi:hypothetical protein [Bythopirellula polymerisocia]|uniref:Uncharacterized protein n=1 Tax=Bythopirellula polymerisocia TaxID=2528003 RepID=A0A5C6CX72_9BACT|nr:hypothetical protein [Bythopirellula polymerisocia]TWU28475.1 hypothetical protein Pla144_17650 [Bythopirellula polymerisocia]